MDTIKIFVKDFDCHIYSLQISPLALGVEVKSRIKEKLGLDKGIVLIYKGQRINDHHILASYNIKNESTLFLLCHERLIQGANLKKKKIEGKNPKKVQENKSVWLNSLPSSLLTLQKYLIDNPLVYSNMVSSKIFHHLLESPALLESFLREDKDIEKLFSESKVIADGFFREVKGKNAFLAQYVYGRNLKSEEKERKGEEREKKREEKDKKEERNEKLERKEEKSEWRGVEEKKDVNISIGLQKLKFANELGLFINENSERRRTVALLLDSLQGNPMRKTDLDNHHVFSSLLTTKTAQKKLLDNKNNVFHDILHASRSNSMTAQMSTLIYPTKNDIASAMMILQDQQIVRKVCNTFYRYYEEFRRMELPRDGSTSLQEVALDENLTNEYLCHDLLSYQALNDINAIHQVVQRVQGRGVGLYNGVIEDRRDEEKRQDVRREEERRREDKRIEGRKREERRGDDTRGEERRAEDGRGEERRGEKETVSYEDVPGGIKIYMDACNNNLSIKYSHQIKYLSELGYAKDRIMEALKTTQGNIKRATVILLNEMEYDMNEQILNTF